MALQLQVVVELPIMHRPTCVIRYLLSIYQCFWPHLYHTYTKLLFIVCVVSNISLYYILCNLCYSYSDRLYEDRPGVVNDFIRGPCNVIISTVGVAPMHAAPALRVAAHIIIYDIPGIAEVYERYIQQAGFTKVGLPKKWYCNFRSL